MARIERLSGIGLHGMASKSIVSGMALQAGLTLLENVYLAEPLPESCEPLGARLRPPGRPKGQRLPPGARLLSDMPPEQQAEFRRQMGQSPETVPAPGSTSSPIPPGFDDLPPEPEPMELGLPPEYIEPAPVRGVRADSPKPDSAVLDGFFEPIPPKLDAEALGPMTEDSEPRPESVPEAQVDDSADNEVPHLPCPQCGVDVPDYEGASEIYAHEACGFCSHPSQTDGACTMCGEIVVEVEPDGSIVTTATQAADLPDPADLDPPTPKDDPFVCPHGVRLDAKLPCTQCSPFG